MTSSHPYLNKKCPVFGMIHTAALPGTPKHQFSPQQIMDLAIAEAQIYLDAGIEGLMIENMHDVPYLKRSVGPEIVAIMSLLAMEIRRLTKLPCGIQILAGANKEALAVAYASGFEFVRAEGFVFGHLADEGLMDADAGELMRYRKLIGAEAVHIFTDIKKKHSSHAISADTNIVETAKAAEFFLSDGLIITGTSTGEKADLEEIKAVKKSVGLPVLVGSGVTTDNLENYLAVADALIIGSYFKKDGNWQNGPDPERIARLMEKKYTLTNRI